MLILGDNPKSSVINNHIASKSKGVEGSGRVRHGVLKVEMQTKYLWGPREDILRD